RYFPARPCQHRVCVGSQLLPAALSGNASLSRPGAGLRHSYSGYAYQALGEHLPGGSREPGAALGLLTAGRPHATSAVASVA
nr:hypothetical protein [Tanacetum cinerariifolium]